MAAVASYKGMFMQFVQSEFMVALLTKYFINTVSMNKHTLFLLYISHFFPQKWRNLTPILEMCTCIILQFHNRWYGMLGLNLIDVKKAINWCSFIRLYFYCHKVIMFYSINNWGVIYKLDSFLSKLPAEQKIL